MTGDGTGIRGAAVMAGGATGGGARTRAPETGTGGATVRAPAKLTLETMHRWSWKLAEI